MESQMTSSNGKGSENLFVDILDLVIVFLMSLLVEWMSHTTFMTYFSDHHKLRAGLIQTGLYVVRMTVAYAVMLAVMSFNAGNLLAAVAGYSLGFLVFGSRVFDEGVILGYKKPSDLPPLNC